jgi:hypothetical protein
MRTIIIVLSLLTLSFNSLFGQLMCLGTKNFSVHPIVVRAQIPFASFAVNFDVIGREAKNINIFPIDSMAKKSLFLYDSCTINNIRRINFLKDFQNYSLVVNYIVKPAVSLSNNYAELHSDSLLELVFRAEPITKGELVEYGPSKSDSLIFTNYLTYKNGMIQKSDILVQRVFENGKDSTIILRNNYPEYKNIIVEKSKEYSKESFTGFKPWGKYFFIRYYILRHIDECGFDEIF